MKFTAVEILCLSLLVLGSAWLSYRLHLLFFHP
jgi:hypothetical protein